MQETKSAGLFSGVKEEWRGGGSELGSDLDLDSDPDPWKIFWIGMRIWKK